METTAIENVSQDVKYAAAEYANDNAFNPLERMIMYEAFVAGAAFQKPIEHNQLPNPDDHGNVLGE